MGTGDISVIGYFIAYLIGIVLCVLVTITARVLLAFAAYYDARACGNRNALMWALLVGFLGLIPGIVYLCLRDSERKRMIVCQNCGAAHPIGIPNCPQCGIYNPYSGPFCNAETPVLAAKAKKLLIAGCVLFGVAILLVIVSVIVLLVGVAGAASRDFFFFSR